MSYEQVDDDVRRFPVPGGWIYEVDWQYDLHGDRQSWFGCYGVFVPTPTTDSEAEVERLKGEYRRGVEAALEAIWSPAQSAAVQSVVAGCRKQIRALLDGGEIIENVPTGYCHARHAHARAKTPATQFAWIRDAGGRLVCVPACAACAHEARKESD